VSHWAYLMLCARFFSRNEELKHQFIEVMTEPLALTRQPRISIPTDNPDDPNYVVPANQWTGVVGYGTQGDISCTGSLYLTGRHIITAAHCFDINDTTPNPNPNPTEYTVFFDLREGRVPVAVSRIFIHPNWTADDASNNDIAVLELASSAPETAERYDVYVGTDEVGQVIQRVGYGTKGTGNGGEVADDNPTKRTGQNRYDALGEIFNNAGQFNTPVLPGTQLAYDFDSGNANNDAFGREFGINDLGLGANEVGASGGDSGGPSFINGQIAGVASYGVSPTTPGIDVTEANDTSFGEFFADTRVSAYLSFIGGAIAESNRGDNLMTGWTGTDTLAGNAGNDTIEGRGSDDILLGGRDNDVLRGEVGNDSIAGNRGNDVLEGSDNDDILFGGQDSDTISGGAGNDVLAGDFGQDFLTGGDGSDTFTLRRGAAATDATQVDVVSDFAAGVDRIALTQGLTEANLTLELFDLNGSGVLVRVAGTSEFLGFVRNATVESLQGSFVADTLGLN